MTKEIASEIAKLLNTRNQLVKQHTAQSVLDEKETYVFIMESEKVIACAESKKVQWYQWEICHVSVASEVEGSGKGQRVLELAEEKAIKGGAKILQSTIRSGNEKSIRLFLRNGYQQVNTFYNNISGNWILVLQKSVGIRPS
jgi:N-acetylglutamate synthase-like GNAT family acetyltransferase